MRKKQAQILIVDDQEEILFSAKMILKKYFETIFTTSSPKQIISILNENEIECFGFAMEYPNSAEKVEFPEGHKFRQPLKKAFASLSNNYAESASRPVVNHDGAAASERLKLRIYSKANVVSFAYEMSKFFVQLSKFAIANKNVGP